MHSLSVLLRCAVLAASLYTTYYLGFCVPYASYYISNNAFTEAI